MLAHKSYIDINGRLAIPAKVRQKLKLKPGDEVSIKCSDNELIMSTYKANLEKARNILEKYTDKNLADELKLLRQQDITKEQADDEK